MAKKDRYVGMIPIPICIGGLIMIDGSISRKSASFLMCAILK